MKVKDLMKDIREGSMKKVYLFRGKEEYLIDSVIDKIVDKYVGRGLEDLNYLEIGEGRENTFEDLLNACETLPFMGEKKLVLLKDLSKIIKDDPSSISKLGDYVLELGDHVTLMIKDEEESLRRNTKLYKNIVEKKGLVEFERLNYRELASWIERKVKKANKSIDKKEIDYFIGLSTYTEYRSEKGLYELENELLKILDHSSGEKISKSDIDAVLIEELDTNIFSLLDALVQKNTGRALKIFNDMVSENEPIPRILFMIMRNYRLILKCKIYKSSGYNDADTRGKLGISPYEYKKINRNSSLYGIDELIGYLNKILEIDVAQKTRGIDEHLAIEMLVVQLTEGDRKRSY